MWDVLSDERNGLLFSILLSHIRDSPNLEGRFPVFISPRKRVAQLYSPTPGSFIVASRDSQGYVGGIRTDLYLELLELATASQYVASGWGKEDIPFRGVLLMLHAYLLPREFFTESLPSGSCFR
jgi:hypothetical protein